jgi:hypothetical protein
MRSCFAALLAAASAAALAWEFGFSAPAKGLEPNLTQGGQLTFQIRMDEDLIKKLNLWPGEKKVKLEWQAPGQAMPYTAWAGQAAPPVFAILAGPFPDGSFSGSVTVGHNQFPHPGKWQVTVKLIERPDVGGDYRHFNVVPAVPVVQKGAAPAATMAPGGPVMVPPPAGGQGGQSGNAPARGRAPAPTR